MLKMINIFLEKIFFHISNRIMLQKVNLTLIWIFILTLLIQKLVRVCIKCYRLCARFIVYTHAWCITYNCFYYHSSLVKCHMHLVNVLNWTKSFKLCFKWLPVTLHPVLSPLKRYEHILSLARIQTIRLSEE